MTCDVVQSGRVYDYSGKPLHSHHRGNFKYHKHILHHSVNSCSSRFLL